MIRIRDLRKLPDGRFWLREKLGLALMSRSMLSKSLIQFSVDGRDCVPSLLFDLRPNYGGNNEDDGDLLQKVPCRQCCRPPQIHASTRDSWTLTGKSGSVSCGVTLPFSCVWYTQGLFVPSKSLFPQSSASSASSMVALMVTSFKRA